MEEVTAEMMKQQMTDAEWNKVYEMSRDRSLYQNLVDSLFPSIHGNDEVKRGQYVQYCLYVLDFVVKNKIMALVLQEGLFTSNFN
jgi:hypothetical protein